MMSNEGPRLAKVVDLRRWREEKGRKPASEAPPPPPEPPRFGKFLRRVGSWIAWKVLPARAFAAISFALLAAGLLGGEEDPVAWEPALFWFVAFLHNAFHEIGHLLAVFGVRYRPRLLRAGPLLVEWKSGRARMRTNQDWRFLFGGHVWFTPVRPSRAREMIVLLAGPLANLLVLGAVLAVSRALQGSWLFAEYVRANLACTALVLLTNLVPLPRTREGYATDGRQILDLLRGRRIA